MAKNKEIREYIIHKGLTLFQESPSNSIIFGSSTFPISKIRYETVDTNTYKVGKLPSKTRYENYIKKHISRINGALKKEYNQQYHWIKGAQKDGTRFNPNKLITDIIVGVFDGGNRWDLQILLDDSVFGGHELSFQIGYVDKWIDKWEKENDKPLFQG